MGFYFYRPPPYADFEEKFEYGGNLSLSNWEISGSTTAIVHDDLSNSLTSSIGQLYCVKLTPSSSSTNAHMALSTGSYFYNVPITKTIKGEAYLRLTEGGGYPSPSGISIKSAGMYDPGYLYGLTTHYGTTKLCLWLPSQGIILSDIVGFFPPANTWINLRMEVSPNGTTSDRLVCSRQDPISKEWIVVDDRIIVSGSSDYRPWSNNNRNGIFVFREYYNNPAVGLYIDNIKFALSSV
jgi:hypothetical protein